MFRGSHSQAWYLKVCVEQRGTAAQLGQEGRGDGPRLGRAFEQDGLYLFRMSHQRLVARPHRADLGLYQFVQSLFGLTPEERDELRGGAVAVAERLRQQHEDEEAFF